MTRQTWLMVVSLLLATPSLLSRTFPLLRWLESRCLTVLGRLVTLPVTKLVQLFRAVVEVL